LIQILLFKNGISNQLFCNNLIYISGEPDHKVSNQDFVDHLESVIRDRAAALEEARSERDANIISSTH